MMFKAISKEQIENHNKRNINNLIGIANSISLHFPWDNVEDFKELKEFTKSYGLKFDAVNSNTFEDFKDYKHSFKFGSLTHTDKSIRDKAIELNVDCIKKEKKLDQKHLLSGSRMEPIIQDSKIFQNH